MKRGDQALFSCIVAFQLPESEVSYSWKFAGGGVSPENSQLEGLGRMRFSSVQKFGFVQEGSGTSGEMDAKYMEDPCSVCIMSQALGNT